MMCAPARCAASAAPGWCALASDGTLYLGPAQRGPVVRPSREPRLEIALDGRRLPAPDALAPAHGSPHALAAVTPEAETAPGQAGPLPRPSALAVLPDLDTRLAERHVAAYVPLP